MARKTKDVHMRDAILSFFKSVGMRDRFEENLAIALWDSTVGKQIALHTEPVRVTQGVMMIKVDEDVWRTELSYRKHELIQEINQKIGKKTINEIKFY